MMDSSDWFWGIVERAQKDRTTLDRILRGLERKDLIRFQHHFEETSLDLQGPRFTDLLPDLSEDGIQDIADWVVTQGRAFYEQVQADPKRMPTTRAGGALATFSGVADNVFYERFNERIPRRT
jgi:hypothetical protein